MRTTLLLLAAILVAPTAFAQKAITLANPTNQELFAGFTGAGFSPTPAAGQLDSDEFAISGASDGDLSFGATQTASSDFARGASGPGVTTGGIYAFTVPGQPTVLGVQPGGSDLTPGAITVRYVNQTGNTILDLAVAYTIVFNNDQGRSNSLNFAYTADCSGGTGSTFTGVPALNFTTPEAAGADPASSIGGVARSNTFTAINIPNNQTFCIQFQIDDVAGSGSRDEVGITDIQVNASSILPVELTTFTATANGNAANLHWETASETNNTGFEVQMDAGNGFSRIDFVQGAGTTLEVQSYALRIADLAAGSYRFRLKQVDLDGAFEFSPVVELAIAPNGYALTATSSFRSEAVVDLSVERAQNVTVAVYNVVGRRVATLMSGTVDGTATMRLDGSSLASGVYFVRAQGETFSATRQVVRVR